MPEKLPACIILTSLQRFEEYARGKYTVFHFPPNCHPRVKNLSPGSVCLILARPYQGAPKSEWTFVGEFTVKKVRLVRGEEFEEYASKTVEMEVPSPESGEFSWVIEFENLKRYERAVKLSECNDIRTSNSRRPLSEWTIQGLCRIKPEDASSVVEAIRRKAAKVIE
jgi:predicted transcriptional regulator